MMMHEDRIEDIIARDGVYVSTVSGYSMKPMLVDRRDTVAIAPVAGRLKKYDVALYRSGGKYVLHRVVKVLPDSYVMCGDNCTFLERGITDEDVIGVLREVWQGENRLDLNSHEYIRYSKRVVRGFYARAARRAALGLISTCRKSVRKSKRR